jgi:hypothetical protein
VAILDAMLVPWILVAAPFGAVVMRLARVSIVEEIGSDYVRAAAAKGLPPRTVIRHATRPSYASVASLVGAWVPTFVTNMVLVEFVFPAPRRAHLRQRSLRTTSTITPMTTASAPSWTSRTTAVLESAVARRRAPNRIVPAKKATIVHSTAVLRPMPRTLPVTVPSPLRRQ